MSFVAAAAYKGQESRISSHGLPGTQVCQTSISDTIPFVTPQEDASIVTFRGTRQKGGRILRGFDNKLVVSDGAINLQ